MHGFVVFPSLHAAEKLWEAIIAEAQPRLKQRRQHLDSRPSELIEGHTVRDQRVIVWPDRTSVIAKRIEDRLILRECAPAPAGEHVFPHHTVDHRANAFP